MAAGTVLFYRLTTAPDAQEFPVSDSSSLAALLASEHNTTFEEALAEGRLYRNKELAGLGDLPGNSVSYDEEYVTMDVRMLFYR